MKKYEVSKLQEIAKTIRYDIITSLASAGSGHIGGSLDLADIFAVLYFRVMQHDPQNPQLATRDKLILSIGHTAPVLYATLANAGYFPKTELQDLRKINSRLQGHPSLAAGLPGVESASGSLGQGLSICVGMALADKLDKAERKIFCICGDGELQEGQVWEAAMAAAHHKLKNIILVIDNNRLQIDGSNEQVMQIEPLTEKWKAFGWDVYQCDGNNIEQLVHTFENMQGNKPKVLIANTIMGKGVAEIENDNRWHGKAPSQEEKQQFLNSLQ